MTTIPQTGFPILDRLLADEGDETRDSLADILSGDTFTAEHVSASTIRTYRRSLRQKGKR